MPQQQQAASSLFFAIRLSSYAPIFRMRGDDVTIRPGRGRYISIRVWTAACSPLGGSREQRARQRPRPHELTASSDERADAHACTGQWPD